MKCPFKSHQGLVTLVQPIDRSHSVGVTNNINKYLAVSVLDPAIGVYMMAQWDRLLNVMEPLLILLVTPLRYLLYKVKMSAVNKGLLTQLETLLSG